jgi:CheY-like chemotaxis protein
MLERVLGEQIVLRDAPAHDPAVVRVDASQMEQVLMNLAVNARDAMPRGGELTIATTNVLLDEASASTHTGAHAGWYVRLSVSDTGTGMSPQVKARIFEPFFTTKGVGKGTGLGLSTVFGIVRQSGGFIAVDSEPGRGTCFQVHLPRTEPSAAVDEEHAGSIAPLSGTETILIAEDNPALRVLIGKVLRGYGYSVLEASDAETALPLAEAHPGTIDVLVTDVVLPGMHGRALADALVRTRPELRVLFASGHSDDTIAEQGVLAPGIMLLRKPFSPEELGRKIRDLLHRQKRSLPTESGAPAAP